MEDCLNFKLLMEKILIKIKDPQQNRKIFTVYNTKGYNLYSDLTYSHFPIK